VVNLIAVGIGGAIGAIARYVMGRAVHEWVPGGFPYGTFTVNVIGCLAFGLIVGLAESRLEISSVGRTFLLVGVLGGFTTFSSFSFESYDLIRSGQLVSAAVNVIGQVALGFAALVAGILLGRAS
jgi:CrcB protein